MSDGLASHLALLGYRHAIGARSLVDLEMPGVPRAIIPGYALRVRSEIFAAEMTRWPELRRAVHDQFVRVTAILAVTVTGVWTVRSKGEQAATAMERRMLVVIGGALLVALISVLLFYLLDT